MNRRHARSRPGASSQQGAHQDAQKLTTTGPSSSESVIVPPSSSSIVKLGAGSPTRVSPLSPVTGSLRVSPQARMATRPTTARPMTATTARRTAAGVLLSPPLSGVSKGRAYPRAWWPVSFLPTIRVCTS